MTRRWWSTTISSVNQLWLAEHVAYIDAMCVTTYTFRSVCQLLALNTS